MAKSDKTNDFEISSGKVPAELPNKTTPPYISSKTNAAGGKRVSGKKVNASVDNKTTSEIGDIAPYKPPRKKKATVSTPEETAVTMDVPRKTVNRVIREKSHTLKRRREIYIDGEAVAKFFGIFLPVLAFIAGQIAQYVLYFKYDRVLLLELVFDKVNIFVLVAASVTALVSTVLVAYGCWKLANNEELCRSWTYSVIAAVLLSTLPVITGFAGIFATGYITAAISDMEEEAGFYLAAVITSYVLGQVVMWFVYAGTGYCLVLSEIYDALKLGDADLLAPMIISSVLGLIALTIMGYTGCGLIDDYENWKAFGIAIPFCLLSLVSSAFLSLVALLYGIIVGCIVGGDRIKFIPVAYMLLAMASMAIIFKHQVPQYVPLIVSAAEIILFWALFGAHSKLSNYADDYHVMTLVVFSLAAVAVLVLQIVHMEDFFPKLKTIKELIEKGQASQEFYDSELKELRASMIIAFIVLAIAMIVGIAMGDRNIPSATMPLATAGGSTTVAMVLNIMIEMPVNKQSVYNPSFFLWTLIGSVLVAIPCIIYMAIAFFIGSKAADL